MSDYIKLQNYARNLLMRYLMGCAGVLDVEPGYKGSLEVVAARWRGKVKVVGRERAGRELYIDPRWREEGARVLAVYLLDCGMVWLLDADRLWALLEHNRGLLGERGGKVLLPWSAVTQHLGGKMEDLRGVSYLSFERYRELHEGGTT